MIDYGLLSNKNKLQCI